MTDRQVTCVNKQPRQNPHEGITHLGGYNWYGTRQQVVAAINASTDTFYTLNGSKRANVGIVNGVNGPYLRTHADGQWNDNLLALSECPVR